MSAVAPSLERRSAERVAASHPAAARPAPLVAAGVTKQRGGIVVLDAVDLTVASGSVVGLVGPNGSGKTTLLRAVAGLLEIDRGTILVAGEPAGSTAARAASALVPDEPTGFDELTIRELAHLMRALWSAGAAAAARENVFVQAFGLEDRVDQRLGTLSRGLRRQASAVAVFALAPALVLVDEATATLDPEAVVVLSEAVAALAARGCGVLLATQNLHFADTVCDEIVLLHRGVVIDQGAPASLRSHHDATSLEGVFLAALGDATLRERVRHEFRAL